MLVQNHSNIIHRWRHANPSDQVVTTLWMPGEVRDIDEVAARQMFDTIPEKMRIVSYFPPGEGGEVGEYRQVTPDEAAGHGEPEVDAGAVPNDSGSDDPSDLLLAANISEAEAATPKKKSKASRQPRQPRRSQEREVGADG